MRPTAPELQRLLHAQVRIEAADSLDALPASLRLLVHHKVIKRKRVNPATGRAVALVPQSTGLQLVPTHAAMTRAERAQIGRRNLVAMRVARVYGSLGALVRAGDDAELVEEAVAVGLLARRELEPALYADWRVFQAPAVVQSIREDLTLTVAGTHHEDVVAAVTRWMGPAGANDDRVLRRVEAQARRVASLRARLLVKLTPQEEADLATIRRLNDAYNNDAPARKHARIECALVV